MSSFKNPATAATLDTMARHGSPVERQAALSLASLLTHPRYRLPSFTRRVLLEMSPQGMETLIRAWATQEPVDARAFVITWVTRQPGGK